MAHTPPAEPSPAWRDGWLLRARACPSPNHGPRPDGVAVDLLVVHSISLPPGQYGTGAVQQLFTNQLDWGAHPYYQSIRDLAVSAHFYIERSGTLWQLVGCDQRAWHAGTSHWRGRERCNDFSIGVELEGLEGDAFEPAQYRQLAQLAQELRSAYPIAQVVGHEHIAPGRKHDPGAGFDWNLLQRALRWPTTMFPSHR